MTLIYLLNLLPNALYDVVAKPRNRREEPHEIEPFVIGELYPKPVPFQALPDIGLPISEVTDAMDEHNDVLAVLFDGMFGHPVLSSRTSHCAANVTTPLIIGASGAVLNAK